MATRRVRAATGAGAVLAYLLVVRLLPLSSAVAGRVSQVAVTGSAVLVGLLWCRAARWSSGRLRLGIGILGVGILAWSAGEATWLMHGWTTGGDGPAIPAVANAGFAVTMTVTPVGAALTVRRPTASLRTLLDGFLIGTSLLSVVWALVIGPQYRAGVSGLGSIAYAMADALIVSLLVLVLGDARPAVRRALGIAGVGMVVMFAGDSTYAYQIIEDRYRFGALPDLLWFAAYVILAVATPQRSELGGEAAMTDRRSSRHFLPYAPFSLAFATAVIMPLVEHRIDAALYGFSLGLAACIVLRQLITLTENRSLTRRLRFRAYHDALTGLANRALFADSLDRSLTSAGASRIGVLYIDLDGFKPINDEYGHEAGDLALVTVARRLLAIARSDDVVARIGGDEFAVLTVTEPGDPGPAALADRVLAALREPLDLDGYRASIGASIGIARGGPVRSSPGAMLRDADAAMYAAKRHGRNRVMDADRDRWPEPVPPV